MTTPEHDLLVEKLAKSGASILLEASPSSAHLMHMAIGVSGEAGELLDAIKKVFIYCREPDVNNILEELGDLEFYMSGIRQAFGFSRAQVLYANYAKLKQRYPDLTYTNEHAKQRADKSGSSSRNTPRNSIRGIRKAPRNKSKHT